jgi:type VI protein secretion system component VasF
MWESVIPNKIAPNPQASDSRPPKRKRPLRLIATALGAAAATVTAFVGLTRLLHK